MNAATVRLSIHVLAASVWVGGQIVLAGLVGTLRKVSPDAPRQVANAFARVAWPAFVVLVASGIWNLMTVEVGGQKDSYMMLLGLKMVAVIVSGGGTALHTRGGNKAALAIGGAMSSLGAVAALVLGVALRT